MDAEAYLMTCSRYIELNPVAASMVGHPADYRWSSFRCNALSSPDRPVKRHELYNRLGSTREDRQASYFHLFVNAIDPDEIKRIRTAAEFSMALGNQRFKEQIEGALKRKIGYAHRGRPRNLKRHACE